MEKVNLEKVEQTSYFTYPAVGGVPSGKIGAAEFKILVSEDNEVNIMIVDAKFGDLKADAKGKGICILDTSVWPVLRESEGRIWILPRFRYRTTSSATLPL
jgi:hypothetical protein